MKPVVLCSILEPNVERTRSRMGGAPAGCALLEIRADHLRADEVTALVAGAGRDVVVTARTPRDGGAFNGSEEERRAVLRAALDAGARYVDVELDGPAADLAAGAEASRVILSHHGAECTGAALRAVERRMAASPAALHKIVPRCDSVAEAAAVRELLAQGARRRRPLACFALGRAGVLTRILAPSWGSWGTYGGAAPGSESAPGQLPASDLLEVHDVLGIGRTTRRFAIIGRHVLGSPSPAMHRAGFLEAGIDARYLPLEIDRIEDCLPLLGPDGVAGIEALAVTLPFKESAARHCRRLDAVAARSAAANTVLVEPAGWAGFNTDGPAVADLARGRIELRGRRAAIVGAGGTARAAAAVLLDAGARVTLYNRDAERARVAAAALGAAARPLADLAAAEWDLLVQATPLGRDGERVLEPQQLRGRWILDAVYGPRTPLVADAAARNVPAADGLDLLVAQGVRQFELMTGTRPRAEALRAAAARWLAGRGRAVDGPPPSE